MTEKEKAAVAEYRRSGCGYKKISQLTGVNENTVKTWCRRNGLTGVAANTSEDTCKCCGAPIEQTPKKKKRVFCSDRCRNKWWNSHLDLVKRRAHYEFTCASCGKTFTVYGNANRKYCSHNCYIEDRFGGTRHD